ncbi:MAG: hypothetical protein H0T89_09605 [Deltaproteobacteria bacterium]|nr:hypothetical protein [Deltaproteobacteria bacterium]MDQ3301127.1 hypothetical protein [Myxococcota bacterium]
MRNAWQILRDAGLPVAAERSAHTVDTHELAAATRDAIAEEPTGRDAEALGAFVFAWQQHWPAAFSAAFAGDEPTLLAWAARQLPDDNRYLKLRRIAIANLAHVL